MAKSATVKKLLREKIYGGTMRRIILENTKLTEKHVPKNVFRITY